MLTTIRHILQLALLLGLCFSCANKPVKQKDVFSQSTDDEFSNIERQRAIESYRLMRLRDMQSGKSRRSYRQTRRNSYKSIKPRKVVKRPPPPPPKPKPLTEEQIMEIKQNLTYFCMKNRKHYKYGDEGFCKSHAQAKFDECKDRYQKNPRMNVVRCVKSKLNL
jgi:integrase